MSKDSEILFAIKHGQNKAVLEHLYKKTLPKVAHYIRKNNGNEDEIKDIFQDAVLIFYKQVREGRFDERYELDGYIYSVSRNLWINYCKKQNRSVPLSSEEFEIADFDKDFLQRFIDRERVEAVRNLIGNLGSPCKELLRYSTYFKLAINEITKKMGYTSDNVTKTYLYRCKKKLVDVIENHSTYKALLKP